jgi:hypothetical protein
MERDVTSNKKERKKYKKRKKKSDFPLNSKLKSLKRFWVCFFFLLLSLCLTVLVVLVPTLAFILSAPSAQPSTEPKHTEGTFKVKKKKKRSRRNPVIFCRTRSDKSNVILGKVRTQCTTLSLCIGIPSHTRAALSSS